MQTLTVPDILMLYYADTFHTGENVFQQFWKYRYDVEPNKILSELLCSGYIKIGNYETSLMRKTTTELKDFLKSHDLPLSGKKQDLIYRILNNTDDNILDEYCVPRNYALTDKGQTVVDENPNVLYAHRHTDYHLSDYDIFNRSIDIKETAYNKIFKQFKCDIKSNQWGLARNDVYTLADISIERLQYKDSLKFLVIGIYIDVSGVSDEFAIKHNIMTPGKNYCCVIYPFSVKKLSEIVDLLCWSVDDFIKACIDIIDNIKLPYSYYDKSTSKEMIVNEYLEYKGADFKYSAWNNQ